jgi:hypothetical protein
MANKDTLKRLLKKGNTCHWCGKEVFRNCIDGIQKHDTATVDHVYSKLQMHTRIFENPKVLACYECNQLRNDIEQRTIRNRNQPTMWQTLLIPVKLKGMHKKCYIAVN